MLASVFVTAPKDRDVPDEYSLGTNPTNTPMVLPVNLCQSPISTASPNPVNVETPRRQHNRSTIGVFSDCSAIVSISASRQSRRAVTSSTVS